MPSTLQLSDIPNVNFGEFMLDSMKKFSDKTAIIDGATDKTMTFNDIIHLTRRLAAGLQGIGVTPGDLICMVAPNMPQYAVTFYASALVAAVFQPINPLYTKDDIVRVLRDCGTKYVVTVQELLPKVMEALVQLDHIQVIVFGEADGCITFDSLLDPRHGDYTSPECDPKTTTLSLLSSSGTTGFPKAVEWSHFGFIATLVVIRDLEVYKRDEKFLLYLPMFHVYGLLGLMAMANFTGFPLVTLARFQPEAFLALVQKHKVTVLHTVPPVMVMLAKHPQVPEYDLSSVSSIVCAAAPLSEQIETTVKARMHVDHITQVYGMTEVGITHSNTPTAFRHKSVGKLAPLVEMRVVDVDSGKTLGKNEEGEIWIRGPNISLGYFNLPEQTKEMFLDDGWVRTGDIGKEDDDGYLFVVDRLKELIKYNAYQVAPATLEDVLLSHDAVADACVIALQGTRPWISGIHICSRDSRAQAINSGMHRAKPVTANTNIRKLLAGSNDIMLSRYVYNVALLIRTNNTATKPTVCDGGEAINVGCRGIPDDAAGELPKAFVVLKPGMEITETDIQTFVAGRVAPHMKIRGGVEFISEIPRSLSGKILRRIFRESVMAAK